MSRRHKHFKHDPKWVTISRVYAPPPDNVERLSGDWRDETVERIVFFGMTTILQRCEQCGFERAFTVTGRAE